AAIVIASVMRVREISVEPKRPTPEMATNAAAVNTPRPAVASNSFPSHNSQIPSRIAKATRTGAPIDTKQPPGQTPQVIVPPDEREAFARFLSTVERQPGLAASLAQAKQPEVETPVKADPIVIAALEVKPLEGSAASSESKEK